MKQYAGIDVSLKEASICVVDGDGGVLARGVVATEPDAIAAFFAGNGINAERIVHESGQLSIWLQRELDKLGLPVICIDARIAHKALSARLNKSDRADAEGLAQLARTGWFTPVHLRSANADRLRTLIGARDRLIRLRKDLEGHVRGVLKTFGIRMAGVSRSRGRTGFREHLAAAGAHDPVLAIIAEALIPAHETLCAAAGALDGELRAIARETPLARRLVTVPGVGCPGWGARGGADGGARLHRHRRRRVPVPQGDRCRRLPRPHPATIPVRRDRSYRADFEMR